MKENKCTLIGKTYYCQAPFGELDSGCEYFERGERLPYHTNLFSETPAWRCSHEATRGNGLITCGCAEAKLAIELERL